MLTLLSGPKGSIGKYTLGPELILNGGMEGVYVADSSGILMAPNWSNRNLDSGSDTAGKEEVIVQNGLASQTWTCDAENEGIVCGADFQVVEGATYRLNIWFRSGGDGQTISVKNWEGRFPNIVLGAQNPGTTWTRYQTTVVASSTGGERIRIESETAGTFYVDGVSLRQLINNY